MLRAFAITTCLLALVACSNSDEGNNPPAPGSSTSSSSGTAPVSTTTPTTTTTNEPPPPPKPSKVVTSTVAVDVGGTARQYVLAVPKTYDANKAYPLIVALHGDGQDAAGFVTFSKLDDVAGDDAVMAFTDHVEDLFTAYDDNTDQKLVKAVIQDVKGKQNIDATKIWGFGYSKGAYMLEELQCRKQSDFTAMAIHAGGAPSERKEDGSVDCPGAKAIPMFVTQGSLDKDTGAEFGADYWASVAGCNPYKNPTTLSYCGAYNGCNAATPVVYCEIPNQPHYPLYDNAAADTWAWLNKQL